MGSEANDQAHRREKERESLETELEKWRSYSEASPSLTRSLSCSRSWDAIAIEADSSGGWDGCALARDCPTVRP